MGHRGLHGPPRPVEAVIPGVQGRILAVLAVTTAELNLRTIARLAQVSPAQASRVLPELVSLGLVERRDVPPSALFTLVGENVVARAVRGLSGARRDVFEELGMLAGRMEPSPISAVVFGSVARGEARRTRPATSTSSLFGQPPSVRTMTRGQRPSRSGEPLLDDSRATPPRCSRSTRSRLLPSAATERAVDGRAPRRRGRVRLAARRAPTSARLTNGGCSTEHAHEELSLSRPAVGACLDHRLTAGGVSWQRRLARHLA